MAKVMKGALPAPILLVDTCVWLDLAKDHHQKALIRAMEALVERNELTLAVPRTVMDELARNRERIIEESGRSFLSALRRAREAVAEFGDKRRKKSALQEIDEINRRLQNLGDDVAEMLNRVEALLANGEIIELSDTLKIRAANRAIARLAPFHRQRNGMGDAVIIEAYADVARAALPRQRTAFVTHNTKDFSLPTGNDKMPHPDLAPLFSKIKSRYFVKLGEALRSFGSEEFDDVMIEEQWAQMPVRRLTEILAEEDRLMTTIWYNRHMVRLEAIEDGRVRLAERDEPYSHDTVRKDIWDGALQAAAAVEKRLGLDNLGPFDDFEWGMVNGKLSALRWVLGDEWDMLDT